MTVASGLVGSVGLGERRAATHFRQTVASELDFILVDLAALVLVRSTGTESRRSAWGFSDHRAVWVGLEFEAARLPPPVRPRFPAARWRFADADARDAYAAYLDESLAPLVARLEAHGLRDWRGNVSGVFAGSGPQIPGLSLRFGIPARVPRSRPPIAAEVGGLEPSAPESLLPGKP